MTANAMRPHAPVTKRVLAATLELVPLLAPLLLFDVDRSLAVVLALMSGFGWLLLNRPLAAAVVCGVRLYVLVFVFVVAGGVTWGIADCHCAEWAAYPARGSMVAAYALPPLGSAFFALRSRGGWRA
jgi:hypothetical protein